MMMLDEAAKLRHRAENPYAFMLSALVHDFGKALCTEEINGILHAYDHEKAGLAPAEAFVRRLTAESKLLKYALNMTELHMKPNVLAGAKSAIKSTNKLFDSAAEPLDLIHLAVADSLGKTAPRPYIPTEPFLMERLEVFEEMMAKPFVMGKDFIEAGLTPDKNFSDLLEYAHKLRLAGCDKNSALKQTLAYARKFYGKK
jgi:tRNA nucleotidyltransferase (CCA-adding enzyme)